MRLRLLFSAVFLIPAFLPAAYSKTKLRIMAVKITNGSQQSYDSDHGTRIFKGLNPDIVLIQEFSGRSKTPAEIRTWVASTFGDTFQFYRKAGAQLPKGVINHYPILAYGECDDPEVDNRDFAWARVIRVGPRISGRSLSTSSPRASPTANRRPPRSSS